MNEKKRTSGVREFWITYVVFSAFLAAFMPPSDAGVFVLILFCLTLVFLSSGMAMAKRLRKLASRLSYLAVAIYVAAHLVVPEQLGLAVFALQTALPVAILAFAIGLCVKDAKRKLILGLIAACLPLLVILS
jgi:hypothetical protein